MNRDFFSNRNFFITTPYKHSYLLTGECLVDKYLRQFYAKTHKLRAANTSFY